MTTAMLYCGDASETLAQLPDGAVRCCVTSPPYWGLRDYGVEGQLGLERTPEEYVAKMVEAFREVRRVLTDDGTLWLNLGDSYASRSEGKRKPKDLLGLPWMVAFALQADGWWLRSDIIWIKRKCLPESVKDRPTRAHDYLFLLSRASTYYYDAEAIAEPASPDTHPRYARGRGTRHKYADGGPGDQTIAKTFTHMAPGVNPKASRAKVGRERANSSFSAVVKDVVEFRNARTTWDIVLQPYPGAHFATFPEELARRCILAGSTKGDTVLDPFGGSGTVAQVATGNGRNSIYIDLNADYLELAKQRIGPMFCKEMTR